jgi:hypothetical protein
VVTYYTHMGIAGRGIALGPDGAMWFANIDNAIGRISVHAHPHLTLSPSSGPPSTVVQVSGSGFGAFETVAITYVDSVNGTRKGGRAQTDTGGNFSKQVTIPGNATPGSQYLNVRGVASKITAKQAFTVT